MEDMITEETKSTVKEWLMNDLWTMFNDCLEEILMTSFQNGQSSIRSVVYKFATQVMLDLLCKDVIGETLDGHIVKILDTM